MGLIIFKQLKPFIVKISKLLQIIYEFDFILSTTGKLKILNQKLNYV
jgi:hypothetical protein